MKRGSRQISLWATIKQKILGGKRVLLTSSGVAGCVILLRLTGLIQLWELAALDQSFQLRPLEPVDSRVVVVGISEKDLQAVGQWPIPDAVLTQLLHKLQTYQPRVIGLDLYRDLPVQPGHSDLLQAYGAIRNLVGIEQIQDKTGPGVPPPPVLAQDNRVGFNNLVFDLDGKVRRGLLYWWVDGKPHKSFALVLALEYLKAEGITPQAAKNDYLKLGKATFRQFQPNDGPYIRSDNGGYQILANPRGPAHHFLQVSMTDVLNGRVPPELLRDRIVLVGSTAVSLKDFFHTSYSSGFIDPSNPEPTAGVELQANLISQIISAAIDGRSLIHVWSDPAEWLWILAWSWLGTRLCWSVRRPRRAALSIVAAGTGLMGTSYVAFLVGWWVPAVPAALAMSGSAVVIIAHIAHLQEELKRSKEFLNTILNTIPDPVFVKDSQHRWIVLNKAYCRFSGYPLEALLEKSDHDVFPKHEADVFRQQDQRVFDSALEQENEEQFTDKEGKTHLIATKRSLHKDAAGNIFLVGVMRDITERKRMEEELKRTAAELVRSNAELQLSASRLHHLANHDPLTGLPNRKLFYERLSQALDRAREHNQLVGLLFLDLDGFKQINDTQGHAIGDLLLKTVSQRLMGCLRSSDTVSRLGGDEFTVILPNIPTVHDVARVAEKILLTLSQPFSLAERAISVTTSIGISLYPHDGHDTEVLVKEADVAMYRAKELGKSRFQFSLKSRYWLHLNSLQPSMTEAEDPEEEMASHRASET